MLAGALLALTLVCLVKADQYLWVLFVLGTLALLVIAAAARFFGGSSGKAGAAAGIGS